MKELKFNVKDHAVEFSMLVPESIEDKISAWGAEKVNTLFEKFIIIRAQDKIRRGADIDLTNFEPQLGRLGVTRTIKDPVAAEARRLAVAWLKANKGQQIVATGVKFTNWCKSEKGTAAIAKVAENEKIQRKAEKIVAQRKLEDNIEIDV